MTLSHVPTADVLDLTALFRRMAQERVSASQEPAATKKARLASWKKHKLSPEQRQAARELFEAVPDVLAVFDAEAPTVLTGDQASVLMEEIVALTEAELVIKGRKERVREMIFGSLDLQFGDAGVEDPELQPGTIEVPSQGKKFCREGGGRQDPDLDVDKLREVLGDEVVDSMTDTVQHPEQVIPAWDEKVFSQERLTEFLVRNPDLIDKIKDAVIPGAPKNVRFLVRPLDKDQKTR